MSKTEKYTGYDDFNLKDIVKQDEINHFIISAGFEQFRISCIPGDASRREYYRVVTLNQSYILMDASADFESVSPFINMDNFLLNSGIRAPVIIFADLSKGLVLLEDFGVNSFTKYLQKNHDRELELYNAATDLLIRTYRIKADLKLPVYNNVLLNKELQIFNDWFVKSRTHAAIHSRMKGELFQIFDRLYKQLGDLKPVLVYRDFMADNLFWLEKGSGDQRVGVIDFQDAVIGSPAYDLVSLLEDARRDVAQPIVKNCIERYLKGLPEIEKKSFEESYAILGVQRNMKIVGIFHRLHTRDKNSKYLNYLPRVWQHLNNNLKHPILSDLKDWFVRYDIGQ
jgi:aminoglycoside/choline kinase family phosphotransferase